MEVFGYINREHEGGDVYDSEPNFVAAQASSMREENQEWHRDKSAPSRGGGLRCLLLSGWCAHAPYRCSGLSRRVLGCVCVYTPAHGSCSHDEILSIVISEGGHGIRFQAVRNKATESDGKQGLITLVYLHNGQPKIAQNAVAAVINDSVRLPQ